MLENGCSTRLVKELPGHKYLTTTQKYTHINITGLKKQSKATIPGQKRMIETCHSIEKRTVAPGRNYATYDASGNVTRYEYDAANRRKAMVDHAVDGTGAQNHRTEYGYDDYDSLLRTTYQRSILWLKITYSFGSKLYVHLMD